VRRLEGLKAASFHPNGAVFFTIEQRSMVFTLTKAQIYSALHSLNQTIRHKSMQFIPDIWCFPQQSVILQHRNL